MEAGSGGRHMADAQHAPHARGCFLSFGCAAKSEPLAHVSKQPAPFTRMRHASWQTSCRLPLLPLPLAGASPSGLSWMRASHASWLRRQWPTGTLARTWRVRWRRLAVLCCRKLANALLVWLAAQER